MATIVRDATSSPRLGGAPGSGDDAPAPRRMTRPRAAGTTAVATGAALVVVLAMVGSGPARAADANGDRDRQRLQARQAEVAAELDAAKATSEELVAALATLDQQVQLQVSRAAEAERAFRDAERRLNEVQAQVDENQSEVDRINDELRQQAIRRYVKPEANDSSVRLLKADGFDDAEQKRVLGDAVAGNSRDLVERLRGARGRIDVLRQQAEEAKREADTRRAEQNDLFLKVLQEREAQARLQAEWDKRVSALQASHDEISAEAAGIDQAIAEQRARLGSAAPAPQSSNGRFVRPVAGNMGDGYGGGRNHGGVDILAPVGTTVVAVQGGRVVQASSGGAYNGGYGNLVVIDHPNGLQTRYAHLSTVRVSVGQTVSQGQAVGAVGMTGRTSGPHLHFEVYLNGTRQNPANYLP